MSADHSRRHKAAVGGVTLALVAFAGFPLGDAVIKSMAGDCPDRLYSAAYRDGDQCFHLWRPDRPNRDEGWIIDNIQWVAALAQRTHLRTGH